MAHTKKGIQALQAQETMEYGEVVRAYLKGKMNPFELIDRVKKVKKHYDQIRNL